MSKVSVTLAIPARINGEKHDVTGHPIEVDEKIAQQLSDANALASEEQSDDDDPTLGKLKKDELITIAEQMGVEVSGDHTKADIIALIEQKREQK